MASQVLEPRTTVGSLKEQGHTQVLEIDSFAHVGIEKILESKSRGCLAQADIEKYYDSIDVLRACRVLRDLGLCAVRLAACLSLQSLTTILICCLERERMSKDLSACFHIPSNGGCPKMNSPRWSP